MSISLSFFQALTRRLLQNLSDWLPTLDVSSKDFEGERLLGISQWGKCNHFLEHWKHLLISQETSRNTSKPRLFPLWIMELLSVALPFLVLSHWWVVFFLLFFSLRYPHPAMQLAGMISSPFKCPRQRRTMEREPQPSVRIDSWRLIMTRKNGCLVPNKHKNCWQILIQHPWETKCSSGWTSTVTQAFLTGNGAPASYFLLICSLRWCHCENFEHGDVETFLWLGVSWQRPGPCQLIQADASLCAKKCENVKKSWGVLLLG